MDRLHSESLTYIKMRREILEFEKEVLDKMEAEVLKRENLIPPVIKTDLEQLPEPPAVCTCGESDLRMPHFPQHLRTPSILERDLQMHMAFVPPSFTKDEWEALFEVVRQPGTSCRSKD